MGSSLLERVLLVATHGGNWLTRSFGAGYPDLDEVVRKLESSNK